MASRAFEVSQVLARESLIQAIGVVVCLLARAFIWNASGIAAVLAMERLVLSFFFSSSLFNCDFMGIFLRIA